MSSKGSFIWTISHRIAHTTAFTTPVMQHELEPETAQCIHHEGSICRPIAPCADTILRGREREMFYLTTHSTHFIYGYMEGRSVLFNDTLNTFYLRLYGVGHMVKDHSDSEKGNPLPPHRLLLSISSKGSFIRTIPQTG